MSWLTRLAGRKDGVPFNAAMADMMSVMFPNKGQALVTDARTGMDRSVWIYRAVATVATRVGSLPWHLMKGDKIVEGQSAALTRPSPNQTGTEFVERIIAWQLLHGTSAVYVEKPAIKGLTVLDMDMVRMDHGNILYREDNSDRQLAKENIVLFPNFGISGQLGLSELRTILDSANMDESAKMVWNNQMQGGGLLAGLFSSDVRLSAQELDAAKKSWEEKYGGVQRAGTIGFLGAGFKFQPLGISAADLKMLEVSSVTRNEIGAAFGVPPIFLGDMDNVAFASATIEEKILYSNTIIPKADRLADRITTFLLPLLPGLKGLTFRFDYTGIECLQANRLERAQSDEIEFRSGKLTINEARIRDGLKPVQWGSVWWANGMLVPVSTSEVVEPEPAPVLPPEAVPVPVVEPKGIKGIHTPEMRQVIARAFVSKTASQEKKFAAVTMRAFAKQEKRVVAYLEGGKSMKALPATELFKAEDLIENWHSLYISFGMSAAEEVAARYDMVVPDGSKILAWVKKQEKLKSKLVNETTMQDVDKIISQLRAEGASIPDMVKATRDYFGGISYRAERVARTETISCNNASAHETYAENGVTKQEWLSTSDDRTRPDHVEADGQVAGIDEGFTVGGETLLYPGDPNGSAENVIQCRCTLIPVI